jgi:hypothetical protein
MTTIVRTWGPALVLALTAATGAMAAAPIACVPPGTCESASVGFTPAYPSGSEYDTFVGPAYGTHVLDANGDGSYADERCDANAEARLALADAALNVVLAVGTSCDALPAGPNVTCVTPPLVPTPGPQEFCKTALGVVAAGVQANAIFVTRCATQDGLVQGAEIESAYENTKLALSRDLEDRLRACDKLVSLWLPRRVGGRLEEVRAFVALRIRQYEAADAQSANDWSREIGRAKRKLGLGDARQQGENFKDAYRLYCDAYRELRDIHL